MLTRVMEAVTVVVATRDRAELLRRTPAAIRPESLREPGLGAGRDPWRA